MLDVGFAHTSELFCNIVCGVCWVLEAVSHDPVHFLTAAICVCCVVVALQKEAQRALKHHQTFSAGSIPPSWSFQILPTLYQHYQKVETISKHFILFLMQVVHWYKP